MMIMKEYIIMIIIIVFKYIKQLYSMLTQSEDVCIILNFKFPAILCYF